jgi:hypothetical protein
MILSAREIRAARERGAIGFTDLPTEPRRWSPTSVDLTLDAEVRVWQKRESIGPTLLRRMHSNLHSLRRRGAPCQDSGAGAGRWRLCPALSDQSGLCQQNAEKRIS